MHSVSIQYISNCFCDIDRGFTLCQVKCAQSEAYLRVTRTLSPFPTRPFFLEGSAPFSKHFFSAVCASNANIQYTKLITKMCSTTWNSSRTCNPKTVQMARHLARPFMPIMQKMVCHLNGFRITCSTTVPCCRACFCD